MLSLYEFDSTDRAKYKIEKVGKLYLVIWYYINSFHNRIYHNRIYFDLWHNHHFLTYTYRDCGNSNLSISDISLIVAYSVAFLNMKPIFRYSDIPGSRKKVRIRSVKSFMKKLAFERKKANIKHENK